MSFPLPDEPVALLDSKQGRQRLVLTALRLTENTALAPQEYERALLNRFVAGEMTIEEVVACLDEQTPPRPAV